jgi:CPA2 family monovalent cation:H+ antiporter-2
MEWKLVSDTLELILLLLILATLSVALFRLLRLPAMLGYLLTGILIGPHAAGWIPPGEETRHLAEFGVVFLMFSVGLEFSLPQLIAMQRTVFGLGSAQMGLAFGLVFMLGWAMNLPLQGTVVLAGALSLSSTAIISRLLAERSELKSPHGQRIMGMMLFQDLAVVPLLVLIPALAQPHDHLGRLMLIEAFEAVVILSLLLGLGKKWLGRWFHWIARQKSSELFLLNVLWVILLLAWITQKAGLSLALGAFVSGVLLAETDYRYQVEDYIKPFRDVLLGLFFITIGTLLDLGVVIHHLPAVFLTLILLLGLKLLTVYGPARALGEQDSVALRTALAMAPAGEFGFVLLAQTEGLHLVPAAPLQIVLAAMLISMILAPFILLMSDRIVLFACKNEWALRSVALHELSSRSYGKQRHVIVCGYGRSGQNLARFLEQEGVSVLALDRDPQRVRLASEAGDEVVFGEAGRQEVLIAAGIQRASALIISFSDTALSLAIIALVRELKPDLPVIVRTRDDSDLDRLKEAGAAEVVPEILEGSLMLASHALLELGIPLSRVLKRIRQVRAERYQLMRGFFRGLTDESGENTNPDQLRLQTLTLLETSLAKGMQLRDLPLQQWGVEITALRRRGLRGFRPEGETRLESGDILILLGRPEALAQAETWLIQGK